MILSASTLLAFFLCGLTTYLCFKVLEGGFAPNPGRQHVNFTPKSIFLAVLSFAAAMLLFGPLAGIALVGGIALHEYGHVAAFRAAGHTDARFRLIPLLGGVAISRKLPKNQLAEFYIAIMGPGIMLVPLVLFGVYIHVFGRGPGLFNDFARLMFIITGAINFFNLLPLWPLDGGRIVRSITMGFSQRLSQFLTIGMSVGLIVWALYARQPLIFIVSILGFSAARHVGKMSRKQPPMTGLQALLATIAYGATIYAHWLAGKPLIDDIFFRTLQ